MKDLKKYIEDITENIKNDRAMALTLLTDIMKSMSTGHDHKDLGQTASKYLETLQRSNEQLVKLASLVHKKAASVPGLTNEDKEDIFDLINEGANDE